MWIIVDSCSSTFSKIHETYMWVSVISYDCDQWTSLTKDGLTAARPLGPSYWHRNHHKSLLGFEKSKFSKLGTPCHDGHDACVRPFDWIILGKKRDRLEWYHTVYMSLQFDICLLLCTYEVHIFVQAKSFLSMPICETAGVAGGKVAGGNACYWKTFSHCQLQDFAVLKYVEISRASQPQPMVSICHCQFLNCPCSKPWQYPLVFTLPRSIDSFLVLKAFFLRVVQVVFKK